MIYGFRQRISSIRAKWITALLISIYAIVIVAMLTLKDQHPTRIWETSSGQKTSVPKTEASPT